VALIKNKKGDPKAAFPIRMDPCNKAFAIITSCPCRPFSALDALNHFKCMGEALWTMLR
jgi:hypothetical protein